MQMQHVLSLVALSEAGSIRSAAASLGRSQPGLTKNLRQIEDELGERLFQRTSRGVIPTKIGQLVLARTRTIATDIRRLQEEVEQTKGGQHGTVAVCVSPFAATQIIPAALLVFRQRFPEVAVQISSGLFPVAIVALREGQTDIVIGPRPPADQCRSLIVEPLVTTDIVIVTSKSSPHAKARSIGDLSDADWMMIGSPGGPGDIFEPVFRERFSLPDRTHFFGILPGGVRNRTVSRLGLHISGPFSSRTRKPIPGLGCHSSPRNNCPS